MQQTLFDKRGGFSTVGRIVPAPCDRLPGDDDGGMPRQVRVERVD